jgi:hypothetical protein
MIGYKVVYCEIVVFNEAFFSATREATPVVYVIGQPTKPDPGNGPLGVFVSLQHALDFAKLIAGPSRDILVLQCEYEQSKHKTFWYIINTPGGKHIRISRGGNPPKGTDFADSVTLLERVK